MVYDGQSLILSYSLLLVEVVGRSILILVVVVVLNSFSSPRLPGFQLLRDTFAGKILTTFQNQFSLPEFQKLFYRQKCRAT